VPEAPLPPAPDTTAPYRAKAADYERQAAATEAQVRSGAPQKPRGFMENAASGLRSFGEGYSAPGGYFGAEERRHAAERQRQQDLYARAKELRGESEKQQVLGLTEEQRQSTGRLRGIEEQKAAEAARHNRAAEERQFRIDETAANKGTVMAPGSTLHGAAGQPDFTAPTKPSTTPPRQYGVSEYQADMDTFRKGGPEGAAAKRRADDFMNTRTQPGVAIAHVRGEEARDTGDLATARKEVTSRYEDFQNYDTNYKTMKEAYDRVTSGKSANPGTDDMVLLFRHIGMTIGAVKGGRVNEASVQAHLNALPATDRIRRMYDRLASGAQLEPAQRAEMMHLGENTRDFHGAQYEKAAGDYQWRPPGAQPYQKNETPAAGGGWKIIGVK